MSNVLLAIADIKDEEKAETCNDILVTELNIPNMIEKVTEIYMHQIGGTPERHHIYTMNMCCGHFILPDSNCIKEEFCEYKHLLPIDHNTIKAGFNLYMVLKKL